jgi:hypothetical protein
MCSNTGICPEKKNKSLRIPAGSGLNILPRPYRNIWLRGRVFGTFLDTHIHMQLLFYSSRDDQNTKRLESAVQKAIPEQRIEDFKSLEDLRERLRKPVDPNSIAVVSVSGREELQQMQPLRGLLTEIYIVLVVPDRKKKTIELAHLLLPRFLSQKDDDFTDLGKVLDKMYRTSH